MDSGFYDPQFYDESTKKEPPNDQWTLNFTSGKMAYKQQEIQLIMAEITFKFDSNFKMSANHFHLFCRNLYRLPMANGL